MAELRNQVAAATSPAEAMKASDALTRQVSGIFAVAESYPDLKLVPTLLNCKRS